MKVFIALLIAVLSPTWLVSAQDPTPLISSTITGPGLEELKIEGEPDEHGLIWQLYVPTQKQENLGILVVNTTEQTLHRISFVAESLQDGEWDTIGMTDDPRFIHPWQLGPGEFGVFVIGWTEFGYGADPKDWEEVRIGQVDFELEAPGVSRVDTPILDFDHEDYEVLTGSITNSTGMAGKTPSVLLGCVVDGELTDITLTFVKDANTRIGSGENLPFEIYIDPAGIGFPCEPTDSYIVWGMILPDV